MLETKFKVAFLLVILAFAAFPIMGILRGTTLTPYEAPPQDSAHVTQSEPEPASKEEPVPDEMVEIPAGPFIRGTTKGGFDEQPQRTIYLDAYSIDRYEVTNHQYQQFVVATGHRKSGPPPRYAKSIGRMRGVNQPVVYVSWDDASEYCRWKGKRRELGQGTGRPRGDGAGGDVSDGQESLRRHGWSRQCNGVGGRLVRGNILQRFT
jgi:formylglycine-generating enzyme required for sulfatase activity